MFLLSVGVLSEAHMKRSFQYTRVWCCNNSLLYMETVQYPPLGNTSLTYNVQRQAR